MRTHSQPSAFTKLYTHVVNRFIVYDGVIQCIVECYTVTVVYCRVLYSVEATMEHGGSDITWGIPVGYNDPGTTLVPPYSVLCWAGIKSIFSFSLHCALMINHNNLVQCSVRWEHCKTELSPD